MPEEGNRLALPLKIVFQFVLTIGLVWLLSIKVEQYFYLDGGLIGYIIIGALFTLMNLLVRPFLHIAFAPFHFIFGLLATVAMNWLFLWLTIKIAGQLDPSIVVLAINGGIAGWLIIAIVLGMAHWVMKVLLKG